MLPQLIFNQVIKDNLNDNQFENLPAKFLKKMIYLINNNGNAHTKKKITAHNPK